MAYNTLYYFEFDDAVYPTSAHWRVQIDSNEYTGAPILLPYMDENPLTIARTSEDESKISPFVGSKATIRYVYDGTSATPHPRVFKDIQENTMLVSIYKNGVLNFSGYVKPDGGQYPLNTAPISYEINATDYINGFKNKKIGIGTSSSIYYGMLSIPDFLDRSLFYASDYTGVAVKIWNRIRPDVIAAVSGPKMSALYLHTDAFFDYDDGADTVYDALLKFLVSFRLRLFFSAGTYWLQRVADAYAGTDTLEYAVPGSNSLISVGTSDLFFTLTSNPTDAVKYVEDSGTVRITPAIYNQKETYQLKALNKLTNFLWENLVTDFSSPNFGRPIGWNYTEATAVGTVSRGGAGSLDDPFYMRVSGSSTGYELIGYLTQAFSGVKAGQYVQLDVKAGIYWSTGQRVHVGLVPVSGTGTAYGLDSSGNWVEDTTEIVITGDKKTRLGNLSITSKIVPDPGTTYVLTIGFLFVQPASDPEDPVPSGDVVHNNIYAPFVRVFSNLVSSIETNTYNSKNYSNTPSDENPVFLDMADSSLSNSVFYSTDGGPTVNPIPFNNWRDLDLNQTKSLDEWAGRTILDNFNVPSNTIEADVISNTLEFHHTLICPDVDDGIKAVQLSDTYDVRAGVHKIVAEQVFEKGTGTGTYTLKSITK